MAYQIMQEMLAVVQSLPQSGDANTDYYISQSGAYNHYRWINNTWVKLSTNDVYTTGEISDFLDALGDSVSEIENSMNGVSGKVISEILETDDGLTVQYSDNSTKDITVNATPGLTATYTPETESIIFVYTQSGGGTLAYVENDEMVRLVF